MKNDDTGIVSFFASHLVALSCVDRTPGTRADANDGFGSPLILTAFLLDVDGLLLMVTAGHILKDIVQGIDIGQEFQQWELHDGLSSASAYRHPIPFSFDAITTTHCVTDEGADYGLIRVNSLTRAALEANDKRPITRHAWENELPEAFDRYLMLGIPSEFQEPVVTQDGRLVVEIAPTIIPVSRIDPPPADLVTPLQRFYGQLPVPLQGMDGGALADIDGMSGGPIFGLRKTEGGMRYWAVAIQSGWWRSRGIINACWLKPMAQEIGDHLRSLRSNQAEC